MEDVEQELISHLLNKQIVDIEFYNINDSYLVLNPNTKWVFDGGIQINFEDSLFCLGWDYENEGFDYSLESSIEDFFGEAPFFAAETKQITGISYLIGSKITDVNLKWDYYQNLDEAGEIIPEKIFIPVELILTFETNDILQLALISYQINENPFDITQVEFNQSGELLISLNNKIAINENQPTD